MIGHSCGSGDVPGHTSPCLCLKTLTFWGQLLSLGMDIGCKGFLAKAHSLYVSKTGELMSLCLGVKSADSEVRLPATQSQV